MQTVATRKAAYGRQVRDTIRNHLLKTLYLRDLYKEWPKAPHTGAWVSYNEWRKIKLALWDFSMHLKQPVPEIDLEVPRWEVHDYLKLGRYVDEDEKPLSKLTHSLNELMKGLGWYVRKAFRNSQHYILYLSPVEYAPQAVPKYLYHFSSLPNKERILRKGLLPKIGRYDRDFMYPPRVHCLTELDLTYLRALAFNIFNHGDMPSIETIYHGGAAAYEMPLVIFRVDTAKLRKGTKFYKDPSVKNGVWTYTHVPPEALAVEHEDVFSEESSVSIRKQSVVAINDDMADWWIPDTPKMKLTLTPKPAAVPTPQATPPELEDIHLIETRKATTAPPTEGELKLLRQFGNLAAYNEARSGSDQDKKDYLVAKWKKINQVLFEGKLEPCNIIFVKDRGVKFKMRGQWNSRTRNLKMHPRCFNAGEEILLETLTHEMAHQAVTDISKLRVQEINKGHGPVWESWMRACGLSANRYDRYGNDTYMDDTETERKENYTKQVDKTQSEWTSRKDLQPGVVVEFLMPKKQTTVIGVIAGESISKSKGTVLHRYVVLVDPFKGTTWLVPRMGLNLYKGANVDMYKKPLWAKKVASLLKYYPMSEVEDD